MRKILGYIVDYGIKTDKLVLSLAMLYMSVLVFLNYQFGINDSLYALPGWLRYAGWYFIFVASFSFPYLLDALQLRKSYFRYWRFTVLLLTAPAIFSWKMVAHWNFSFSEQPFENLYWNQIVYWPLKLIVVAMAMILANKLINGEVQLYGLKTRKFDPKPYLTMLFMMLPLIAVASTQQDFLNMYPRMQQMPFLFQRHNMAYKLLYELAYGSDFITIELFFRGFLVIAFARWAGRNAILPMACFYCTIHFGKPLGECISSFFGGMILGIVIYHTKTILGGLMVHLGIAWMMELGGYLGHLWRHP